MTLRIPLDYKQMFKKTVRPLSLEAAIHTLTLCGLVTSFYVAIEPSPI